MKNKIAIAINIHSFVDVITNSSTELFVCNTDKSVDMVADILREKLEQFNTLNDTNHTFEETFEYPYIYTQEMCDKAGEYAWGYENQGNVGKIIIESASDNTIPYEMWDLIDRLFDTNRHHLG